MGAWNIAVIGATGIVGQAIISLLEESVFSVGTLLPIASDNSTGETLRFNGSTLTVQSLSQTNWNDIHLAFLVTRSASALEQALDIAKSGLVVIDCSGFFANSPNIPLVLPGINEGDLVDYRRTNMVALPNPIVTQLLKTALAVTHAENVRRLDVTSYLPASFYGKDKIEALAAQTARLLNGLGIEGNQIAFNLEPARGTTLHDEALTLQCRRILNNDRLEVSFNATNVPVFYGLAQNVNLTTEYPIDIESFQGCDETQLDITHVSEADRLSLLETTHMPASLAVGEVSPAYGVADMVHIWSRSDNVRYLGAWMAVRLANQLIHADF